MPVPTIFLMNNGEIVEMKDQPYDSEDVLQSLLAKHPSVLAGDQMNGSIPVKWLLVQREAGIPDEQGGAERWSVDHVFIDQNGVPTFVEVKRISDSRIRREVVGQMLDYAANAVMHWPNGSIQERFEQTCQKDSKEADMELAEFIGTAGLPETENAIARFWETVETNLRAGKIRLIFAADQIPPELRRVVEFLDEQMNPAEVLAIEIRQYVGIGVKTLVPSVIRSSKRLGMEGGSRTSNQWDRESFMNAIGERRGPELVTMASAILEWATAPCPRIRWGQGRIDGSCFIGFSHKGVDYFPLAMWTGGTIQLQCQILQQRGAPLQVMQSLASALNEIPGINISADSFNRYPSFQMSLLKDPQMLSRFLQAIGTFVEQITTPASVAALS